MTPADELAAAADKLRIATPAEPAMIRAYKPIAKLLDSAAKMAREYPDLAREHDRPTCDDYACDVMGHALAVARAILGTPEQP